MKTLILIRHGKSDWSAGVPDKERPLNKRGLRNCPLMGNILQREGLIPERMYVSSAKRTTQTAQSISKILGTPQNKIISCPELYLCDPFTIDEIITFTPPKYNCIAIVGHNPALSQIAGQYSQQSYVDLPTLGVFAISFKTDSWEKISSDNATKQQFLYPKLFE